MKVMIYCFTGTGNSLLMARKIANQLEDAEIKPVWKLKEEKAQESIIQQGAEAIGFIFPVYCDRVPQIVRKSIEEAQFHNIKYCFGVTTSGGSAGNALYELDGILKSKGIRLDYGKNIDLSDNSIVIRTSEEKALFRFGKTDMAAKEIAQQVNLRKTLKEPFKKKLSYSIMGKVIKNILIKYYMVNHKKIDPTRCKNCKLCINICPVQNITVKDGIISFGGKCEQCFACINWCPEKAIIFGKIDPQKRSQYHCPGIYAKDIKGF